MILRQRLSNEQANQSRVLVAEATQRPVQSPEKQLLRGRSFCGIEERTPTCCGWHAAQPLEASALEQLEHPRKRQYFFQGVLILVRNPSLAFEQVEIAPTQNGVEPCERSTQHARQAPPSSMGQARDTFVDAEEQHTLRRDEPRDVERGLVWIRSVMDDAAADHDIERAWLERQGEQVAARQAQVVDSLAALEAVGLCRKLARAASAVENACPRRDGSIELGQKRRSATAVNQPARVVGVLVPREGIADVERLDFCGAGLPWNFSDEIQDGFAPWDKLSARTYQSIAREITATARAREGRPRSPRSRRPGARDSRATAAVLRRGFHAQ